MAAQGLVWAGADSSMIEPAHGEARPAAPDQGDRRIAALDLDFVCAVMDQTGFKRAVSLLRCRGAEVIDQFDGEISAAPLWLDSALIVVADPNTATVFKAELGSRPRAVIDTDELTSLLFGGAARGSAHSQAKELSIESGALQGSESELLRQVFINLLNRLMDYDLNTIQLATQLSSGLEWPLRTLMLEAERAMLRAAEDGVKGHQPFAALMSPPPAPLPASGLERKISLENARRALTPGGSISGEMDHFETRPAQLAMLDAVVNTLNEGGHALIEAGTGTGKSFAYLVPAVMYAATNARRVVVSTATINLQDQLFEKDLPRVVSALDLPVRTALVKGRNNYLCIRRWTQLIHSESLTLGERSLLVKTLFWVPHTLTGDRAELSLNGDEEQAWNRVCALAEACTPLRCQYHRAGLCFVARARKQAEASHIVVINHALLLTDLLTESRVLPDYDHLVIDEAHHLENEATNQLGWSVGPREMTRHLTELVDSLSGPGRMRESFEALRRAGGGVALTYGEAADTVRKCREAVDHLSSALNDFVANHAQSGDAGQLVLRVTSGSHSQPAWSQVEIAWDSLVRSLYGLAQHLTSLVNALEVHAGERDEANEIAGNLATEAQFWETVRVQLQRTIGENANDTIVWLSRVRGEEVVIHLAPLEVSQTLAQRLFEAKECVILTSATLTTAGRFDYVRTRLGLDEVRELRVASPFEYARSAIVCVPSDMPEPTAPNYQRGVEWTVGQVVRAIGGRTLVLFTSYSQLRATYQAEREELALAGITVLAQGADGSSRGQLLETFRHRQPAVLFGTSSFWEGVDVVGEALSCVIMPRLPFSVPTDPIFQARSELFEDPFRSYAVPQAVLRFRQGFGRLIRSQQDRGAFIVLDRRILSKFYGSLFLQSLPDARLDTSPSRAVPDRVSTWLSDSSAANT